MFDAKASNWALEKFRIEGGSFALVGSTESYASFSRGFNEGDTVFYAAADDDGNREAGYGVYRANKITERVPTATLVSGAYNDNNPGPLPFGKGGTIAGTFNAIAFNTLWEHLSDEDNPHNVTAEQIELDPELDFGDAQNVQKALEYIFGRFTKVQDDIPQNPEEGDLWVDTANTMELYVYHNGSWISMTGAGGGGGGAIPDNVVLDDIDGTIVGKLLGREIDEVGKGRWRQIYTSDVVTEGAQPMFRSKETGRFTKATDPSAIRDQQTANWFLYETMMAMGDANIHVDIDPPDDPSDGDMWYDTVRLELFVYAEGAWLPCSPLGARVDAGEILQSEILSRVEAGEAEQKAIKTAVSGNAMALNNKLGKDERNTVTDAFRILCDDKTFISANNNELGLYNLRTPSSGPHAANKDYVDGEIDRKIAAIEFPEADVDKAYVDQQDDALDARITSGEQLQNQILADVRQNKNDIGSINILSQQNYGRSVQNQQDIAELQANTEATQPLLWKYMGQSVAAEDLGPGEFTYRYSGTQGSSDGWVKIYTSIYDASGQTFASQVVFQHDMTDKMFLSMMNADGGMGIHMKAKVLYFNVGSTDKYHRFEGKFWRVAKSTVTGNSFILNVPGFLPTYGKPSDIASFSLPDEPPCGDIPPEAEA